MLSREQHFHSASIMNEWSIAIARTALFAQSNYSGPENALGDSLFRVHCSIR